MNVDLTHGSIFRGLLRFSLPLMAGNLLQQLYNTVDGSSSFITLWTPSSSGDTAVKSPLPPSAARFPS